MNYSHITPNMAALIQAIYTVTGYSPINSSQKAVYSKAKKIAVMIMVDHYFRPNDIKDRICPGASMIAPLLGLASHASVMNLYQRGGYHFEFESRFKEEYERTLILFKKLVLQNEKRPLQPCIMKVVRIMNQFEKSVLIGKRV